MNLNSQESKIHFAFDVTIFLKGIHAILEIIGGILIYFISKEYIVNLVLSITKDELSEDPASILAQYLVNATNNFSVGSQHFVALYLLSHGVIKLVLVTGLLRKKLWAYPASIVVFSLFIIYQLHRLYYTHSLWLLLFTILDVAIIWLTAHEYTYMKKRDLFAK